MPNRTWFVVEKGGKFLVNTPTGSITSVEQWSGSILYAMRYWKASTAQKAAQLVGGHVVAYDTGRVYSAEGNLYG